MEIPSHKQVLCFLEVCRDFHFSNAARRLGMAQPPLSRHIKELEALLGTQLFTRSGRRVSLTAAGDAFLREVFPLPSLLGRAVEAAKRASAEEASHLRIGFVDALLDEALWDVFQGYRSAYPTTQLSLLDLAPSEVLREVEAGRIDGGFLGVLPEALPAGVRSLEWREEPLFLCVPLDHELAGRKRVRLEELAGEAVVGLSRQVAPSYRDFLDTLHAGESGALPWVQETSGVAGLLSMVVAGCGVAILPRSAIRLAEGRVAVVGLQEKRAKLCQVFVYREGSGLEVERWVSALAATVSER